MNITFDTNNPKDLEFLDKFLSVVAPTVGAAVEIVQTSAPVPAPAPAPAQAPAPVAEPEVEAPAAKTEAPKRGRKAKAVETAVAEPEAAPQVDAELEPEFDNEADQQSDYVAALSLDEVRSALQQYTAANGIVAGLTLLRKYNAGRVSELDAKDYAAFAAECAV
jgi:hypothetical protein